MNKYTGINKFFFSKQTDKNCNHLKYAIDNNLLDISEEASDIETFNSSMIDEYLNMHEAFAKNTNEIPDAIKYFVGLKTKVLDYFQKTHPKKLKNTFKNFQITYEGLFSTLDFIKIDKESKTITWYTISPSTWDTNKYFKKSRSVGITAFRLVDKEAKMAKVRTQKIFNDISHAIRPTIWQTDFPEEIFNAFIPLNLFKADKKQKVLGWLYNIFIIHKNYPDYKIITRIPHIRKTTAPYSFHILENTLDPDTIRGQVQIKSMEHMMDKAAFWFGAKGSDFTLPEWQSKMSTNTNSCFACSIDKKAKKIGADLNLNRIQNILQDYSGKIAMFDFETINDPLPNTDFYMPYSKIVVQVSIHLMEDGAVTKHLEYIVKDLSKEELTIIYDMLVKVVQQGYKLVAYYATFETAALREMESVLKRRDISQYYDLRKSAERIQDKSSVPPILDLMDFFKKPSKDDPSFIISLNRFGPSKSIKKTIELYAGDNNPYKTLTINNGFQAMSKLYDVIVNENHQNQGENNNNLLQYCKQDTLTMVEIYQKISEIVDQLKSKEIGKEELIKKLDK